MELFRPVIPRKVRTLQTLSLRPPEESNEVDIVSKNWLTALWSGRLVWGKNGSQMMSHRHAQLTCSPFRILRNSEIGDDEIGVALKTGLSWHSSSWSTSES